MGQGEVGEYTAVLPAPTAAAVVRCLAAEAGNLPGPIHPVATLYFDGPGRPLAASAAASPQSFFELRVVQWQAQAGEREPSAFIEARRFHGGKVCERSLCLPVRQLRYALRPSTCAELLEVLPDDLEPSLALTASRQVYSGAEGWTASVDSGLRVSAASRAFLRSPFESAMGQTESTRANGKTLITVRHLHGALPSWLVRLLEDRQTAARPFVFAASCLPRPAQAAPRAAANQPRGDDFSAWFQHGDSLQ